MILLLLCAAISGNIEGPDVIPSGKGGAFHYVGLELDEGIEWDVEAANPVNVPWFHFEAPDEDDQENCMCFTGPDGKYTIVAKLMKLNGRRVSVTRVTKEVVIGSNPGPDPPTPPVPPVPPVPPDPPAPPPDTPFMLAKWAYGSVDAIPLEQRYSAAGVADKFDELVAMAKDSKLDGKTFFPTLAKEVDKFGPPWAEWRKQFGAQLKPLMDSGKVVPPDGVYAACAEVSMGLRKKAEDLSK